MPSAEYGGWHLQRGFYMPVSTGFSRGELPR